LTARPKRLSAQTLSCKIDAGPTTNGRTLMPYQFVQIAVLGYALRLKCFLILLKVPVATWTINTFGIPIPVQTATACLWAGRLSSRTLDITTPHLANFKCRARKTRTPLTTFGVAQMAGKASNLQSPTLKPPILQQQTLQSHLPRPLPAITETMGRCTARRMLEGMQLLEVKSGITNLRTKKSSGTKKCPSTCALPSVPMIQSVVISVSRTTFAIVSPHQLV